ncbi:MAG: LysM peptidoglycan-binding domain-containing protein [Caldilineaceae bacterium]
MQKFYQSLPQWRRIGLGLTVALVAFSLWLPGAALAAPLQGAERGNCRVWHPVQYGQTLQAIANDYGVSVWAVLQANRIDNPNRIYAGQNLCIPGWMMPEMGAMHDMGDMHDMDGMGDGHAMHDRPDMGPGDMHDRPDMDNRPSQPMDDGGACYIVRPGDTLARIAWRYGVDVPYMMRLNGLADPNHLEVGMRLKVPGNAMPPMPEMPRPQPPQPQPPQIMNDWHAAYYNNENLQGSPQFERTDADINFNWGNDGPGNGLGNDNFSVRWTRDTYFSAGNYRFFVTVDDGLRLYVDNILVIDSWRVQPPTNYFGDIMLSPGNHSIRVEYYEETGGATIHLTWQRL